MISVFLALSQTPAYIARPMNEWMTTYTGLVYRAERLFTPQLRWYSLRLHTEGWLGWVDLAGWLHTKMVYPSADTMVSYRLSICTNCLSRTDVEIWSLEDFGVMTLTLWDHVTSPIAWPLDSQYMVSYRWSFETIPLSRMVAEILCEKDIAKHIPTESALIPIFVLGSKIRGYNTFSNLSL